MKPASLPTLPLSKIRAHVSRKVSKRDPSPFIEGAWVRSGGSRRLLLILLVQSKKCVASFETHLPGSHLREDLFAIEGDLIFLLALNGFNNHDFMISPFEFTFRLLPHLQASRLWADPKTWISYWEGQPSFLNTLRAKWGFILKITAGLER